VYLALEFVVACFDIGDVKRGGLI